MSDSSISMVSADAPDWTREHKGFFQWAPSKSLLASIRRYQRAQSMTLLCRCLLKYIAVIQHRFWSVITGAEIPLNTQIAGGLLLPHPNGIVIHPNVKIGPNCLILQQVTLGSVEHGGTPTIGGHVDIGAGAKVLGAISIGDHAKIGANAVVLIDVPANQVAVGVPARILG